MFHHESYSRFPWILECGYFIKRLKLWGFLAHSVFAACIGERLWCSAHAPLTALCVGGAPRTLHLVGPGVLMHRCMFQEFLFFLCPCGTISLLVFACFFLSSFIDSSSKITLYDRQPQTLFSAQISVWRYRHSYLTAQLPCLPGWSDLTVRAELLSLTPPSLPYWTFLVPSTLMGSHSCVSVCVLLRTFFSVWLTTTGLLGFGKHHFFRKTFSAGSLSSTVCPIVRCSLVRQGPSPTVILYYSSLDIWLPHDMTTSPSLRAWIVSTFSIILSFGHMIGAQ